MSQELVALNVDLSQLPSTQLGSDADFAELSKGGDFLGRLQLFGKGKPIDRGLIKPGHYGVPDGDEIVDLGNTIDVIPLARRPKALDMRDKENLIAVYDNTSAEFKRIAAMSAESDSNCMYGVSFLVYERTLGRFLEFFCGTKSTRSEAKKIYPFLPLTAADIEARGLEEVVPHGPIPLTLKSKLVEKPTYSWWVPVVQKTSTPFTKVPTNQEIITEVMKFVTPKVENAELVQEEEAGSKRRAR